MSIIPRLNIGKGAWIPGLPALLTILVIACGGPAATVAPPAAATPSPAATAVATADPTPTLGFVSTPTPGAMVATATPRPTPTPGVVASARDSITVVAGEEPTALGSFSTGCSGNVPSMVCEEIATDPLTWIDSSTFEVVPLSGVESWSQEAPDRWRFRLKEGVTFHNGEPWDAAAAKVGIDWHGDSATAGHSTGSYGFHGDISGEVVDDLTVDVVCGLNCPILPRTTIFLKFQAPEWWASASDDDKENLTVGLGPYQIVEWRRGIEVELEAFEDYQPNASYDSQAPSIQHARQVWRGEALVRASMVAAGEADLAFEIGFANRDSVPRFLTGTNSEVVMLVADNIWHPELKKKAVREALALAIDCEGLMESIYDGFQACFGTISQRGTVGVNETNSAPYPYDPARARQLLAEASYDPANEVIIYDREGRFYNSTELWEAVVGQWQEVGVNASLQITENSKHQDIRRSGCGHFEDRNCVNEAPPPPFGATSHYYSTPSSNESLDMQRQLLLRNSCGNVNSRVCDLVPGFEDRLQEAIQEPLGPERTRKLEELTTIIHDEYWFIPMFEVVTAYGLVDDLEWTPRYDPRTRINTMHFSQ